MKKITLKTKILFSTIFIGVLLSIFLGLFIFKYLNNNLVDQKIEEISKLKIEQVHESVQIIQKYKVFTEMLGTRTRVKEYLLDKSENRKLELTGIFNDYIKLDEKYLAIYLLDDKGVGLVSTDSRFLGQNYSFRDYFINAMEGTPFVDVSIGKTSNQFGYYLSYPVKSDNGLVLGVLVVKISNLEMDSTILKSEISKDSTIMLLDRYGVVLVSNKPERFLSSMGNISIENTEEINKTDRFLGQKIENLQYDNIQKIIDNYRGSETIKFYDKEDKETEIISVSKLENEPFYLVLEVGLDKIENITNSTTFGIVFIIIVGILIISIIINKLILVFIKPLDKFKIALDSISKGDLSDKIDIKTNDEFGDLAKVFNDMTDNLKNYQLNLEDKVKERTLEIDQKVLDLEDSKKAIINLLEDIQEEKSRVEVLVIEKTKELSSEKARLLASINSLSFGFIIADMDDKVILKNDAIIKLLGIKDEDDISINNISELLGNHLDIKAQIELCIKDKKLCEIKEIPFGGKFFRGIIAPIFTKENNETIGYVFLIEDITEELAISKAKTEFVSLASHQLRTPLSAINWYTEMLLSGDAGKLNQEQSEFLEDIITSSKRMSSLVGTLLNVSRIELGTFAINPENKDIWEIVKDEVEDLKVQFDDKKIELELPNDTKPLTLFIDPKLMSIVIQNLLTNSIKYNSSGGKVIISINKKEDTNEVVLSIIDTGYGIPKENQAKIFTKMYRADNAVAIDADGSGIGLYMVKSILETSGCNIYFESPPKGKEKGTAFYVHIPKEGMKQVKANKRLGDAIS